MFSLISGYGIGAIPLGTAQSFGVLAASTVTNTGPTTVMGHVGTSVPTAPIVGFPPGVTSMGTIHAGDALALQAQTDLTVAYNAAAGMACTVDLTGQDLGGKTLTPGVYCFSSSAQLTGTLTLDVQGNPNAMFVFRIGSTLTTASGSTVTSINGNLCDNSYWQIGSSATIGSGSTFAGDLLALTSITLNGGANTSGRALARNAAVTLDSNNVNTCAPSAPLDQQIQALIDEKISRTTEQQKLDSHLLLLLYPEKFLLLPKLRNKVKLDANGNLTVTIDLRSGSDLTSFLATLNQLQISVLSSSMLTGSVRAIVAPGQMEILASIAQVRFIDIDHPPLHNKASTSEGDKTHQADVARSSSGKTGADQKVCVISNGISSLASRQGTGDLPGSIYVLPGQAGNGDEGTAMLEIVFDLAPGATLGFATSNGGEARFAQNILDLADTNKGACHIIVDDTDYVTESPFQDGVIATAVNTVTTNGVLYFSSAGNSGNLDSNLSGTWEGDFSTPHSVPLASNPSYLMHEFGSSVTSNPTTSPSTKLYMHWADPAGKSSTDYDFYVVDPTGQHIVAFSNNTQNGTQSAFEYTEAAAPYSFDIGSRLIIAKPAGAQDRMLNLQSYRGTMAYATSGATRGHSAAANSLSVAATPAVGPYPNAFTSSARVEMFSSDGPRRIFFDVNGNLLASAPAGNFRSTGGVLRQKPDITAADGVKTDTPGFIAFYGTSAAAPHAAAIAALVRQANPGMTGAQLRTRLLSSAVAINNLVESRGVGVLMAQLALPSVVSGGALDVDGDGKYEALTDGMLVLRWLFGLTGPALVNGAIGTGALRSQPADIIAWLEPRRASFDVDGNNAVDAPSDGLMILRYMFGLRGSSLIGGAVGAGASRGAASQIEAYISGLMP